MKIIRTIGFCAGFWILSTVTTFILSFVTNLLVSAVDPTVFIGELIYTVVACSIIGAVLWWGSLFLSLLIPGKISGCICFLYVLYGTIINFLSADTWGLILICITWALSSLIPVGIQILKYIQEEKELKLEKENQLREDIKREVIEELNSKTV